MDAPLITRRDFDTLDEWLDWQSGLSAAEIELGLERVTRVLGDMGLSRPPLVITVGGTNGKGSAVALLEQLARQAGRRPGVYTSPHLVRYNERIRLDGREAEDSEIIAAFRQVESARGEVPLTYFEYGTLAALAVFEAAGTDCVLLEVGLGGRLDATNAVDADGVIITSVSLDHEEWLGSDVESIGREKAGIMRHGRPAVFGGRQPPASVAGHAAAVGADLRLAGRDFRAVTPDDGLPGQGSRGRWDWEGRRITLADLPRPVFGGSEQIENAAAVFALLEALELDAWLQPEAVARALALPGPAGRQQRLRAGADWWLDVAHNGAAARALADRLAAEPAAGTTFALVGLLADKDALEFTTALAGVVDEWLAVPLESSRGTPVTALAATIANATGRPCRIEPSVASAVATAQALAGPADRVVAAGSFYVVGPALEALRLYSPPEREQQQPLPPGDRTRQGGPEDRR
ncbi:bifunctional folylpolyglutamate synthase/dihydrofolate synthase [Lentisalinibacter sediminis]|uniref:bifunctional folylpolyglutamate synthase/dihydrofolate synthase n=1 Tax=Lentisalinibacter sediminis TaxID=2992237 RepID=UPI00386B65FE